MIKFPRYIHLIIICLFAVSLILNFFNFSVYSPSFTAVLKEYFNNIFSVVLGFYLSGWLAVTFYNNQVKRKLIKNKNIVTSYLKYLNNNLKKVSVSDLSKSIEMGYLDFQFLHDILDLGEDETNQIYFKLIGYLNFLEKIYYEILNSHLINPTANPIRCDQTKIVNETINYIKDEIKKLNSKLSSNPE